MGGRRPRRGPEGHSVEHPKRRGDPAEVNGVVVVNLLEASYLDSTALSVLTGAQKQARRAGGNVGLVYNQPQIEKIFTITGLAELFSVFRTEADAVRAARSWSR